MNDTHLRSALKQLELVNALQRIDDTRGKIGVQILSDALPDLTPSTERIEKQREHKRRLLARMIEYAETSNCRRQFILNYFGDHGSADAPDCCDNHTPMAIVRRTTTTLNIGTSSTEKPTDKIAAHKAGSTLELTLELAQQGLPPAQIAEQRQLSISTIYGHLEQLVAAGRIAPDRFVEPNVREQILAAIKTWDGQWLSSLKELLPAEISYDQIRFVVAAEKTRKRTIRSI